MWMCVGWKGAIYLLEFILLGLFCLPSLVGLSVDLFCGELNVELA